MTTDDDILKEARNAIKEGNKEQGAKLLLAYASRLAKQEENETAAKIYEEAAVVYRDLYNADEAFNAYDNATLMLVRLPQSTEVFQEIVRISKDAAKIAEEASEFKKAADYYFRAQDFVDSDGEKNELNIIAADALENLADIKEENEDFAEAVSLLRKVSRLYYTGGDDELGERINDRASRLARKWANIAKAKGDYLSAGNALAEAAQIMDTGENTEAARIMMEAGELYEAAELFEKAGNIYDAAQENYKLQRLTSARNQAMSKAAEAYLKTQGTPEAVAPLLVKGGNMFLEIGRPMKAKWAFKRGNELFGELAEKAKSQRDTESEMKYYRFQAMCLEKWGERGESEKLYKQVIDHYLLQATKEEENDNKELQALALEEAAEVLNESGNETEANKHLERAIELYVELADASSTSGDSESGSKLYSKAAECALKLGNNDRFESFRWVASEKAENAAEYYQELGVPELATIWIRTAGMEALVTKSPEMLERAIIMLTKSGEGFKVANEPKEAFEDFFTVFETRFMHYPEKKRSIKETIKMMDEMAVATQDEVMLALMSLVRALNAGNHIGALLILQENEEALLDKAERIRAMIAQSKSVRPVK
ncbi:MAG: hypothetical protein ACFFE2_07965 [Candidatus Thorarchaeota archaeon]